jgi:cell division protein ZapB
MAENPLKTLEQKIDELIALCEELGRENRQLRAQSAGWQRERQELIDKNQAARSKVEAMLGRLRAME